jgi:PKD repeat protein
MRRLRFGRLVFPLLVAFLLQALLLAAPVAGGSPTIPLPASMAAVGDSITRSNVTFCVVTDSPQNSWSTGWNTSVNSHYLRLLSADAPISGNNYNFAVSGAKMADLNGQIVNVVGVKPDYLTVLMGGNDLCTSTVQEMTSVSDFRAQFDTAMQTLTAGAPNTHVYIVSIPNVHQLWELFRSSVWARLVWASAGICQSLLANPTSTRQADVQRRQAVYDRNVDFNTQLAQVCALYPKCHFDGNAAFNTTYTRSDVAGDYFHPSIAGQAKLAAVSWGAGYTFGSAPPPPNAPPVASFTFSCEELTCTFTDTSVDPDGSVTAWSWTFGDSAGSALQHPVHTYASDGSYTVTLTVTDDDGATHSASQTVAVSGPPPPSADLSLEAASRKVKGVVHVDLSWTGSSALSFDVFRNGNKVGTTGGSTYTDSTGLRGGGVLSYQVCEAGSDTCSDTVTVSY